jgi:hypothetical protein
MQGTANISITWQVSEEDSAENRIGSISYLQNPEIMVWPDNVRVFDGNADSGLLDGRIEVVV